MIDPAGETSGRLIEDCFERGITIVFGQALKEALERELTDVRVVLTRTHAEILEPLQNAAFANRLNVDYYVRFQFYHEQQGPSQVYCYHVIYDPATDYWVKSYNPVAWYDYTQAYLFALPTTKKSGKLVVEQLKEQAKRCQYEVNDCIGLPCKPLLGINAQTTLLLEIGLKNKNDWQRFIEPIKEACKCMLKA